MQNTLSVINLSAIRSNALKVKSMIAGVKFFAVVKADAYGHGALEVSREIEDIVDGFCVAIVDEGVALRVGGISKPILVFAPPLDEEDGRRINHYNLTATVTDFNSARLSRGCRFHIAVNTGMNRYGCNISDLSKLIKKSDKSALDGVYSHLFLVEDGCESVKQLLAFKRAEEIVKDNCPNVVAHLSASGGIVRGGSYLFDGVRCGIMLYGYSPAGFKVRGLTPALKVYAPLAHKTTCFGGGVGYNLADKKYDRLYTYRLGYADGFSRNLPLGEKTLCMDAFVSEERHKMFPVMTDAEKYAKRLNTISYEVLCSVTRRSKKVYERRAEIQI